MKEPCRKREFSWLGWKIFVILHRKRVPEEESSVGIRWESVTVPAAVSPIKWVSQWSHCLLYLGEKARYSGISQKTHSLSEFCACGITGLHLNLLSSYGISIDEVFMKQLVVSMRNFRTGIFIYSINSVSLSWKTNCWNVETHWLWCLSRCHKTSGYRQQGSRGRACTIPVTVSSR